MAAARNLLRDLGWPVLEASSALEAESLLANIADISLVLSDITMPDGDGPSLLKKAPGLRPGVRAFLMTGLPANSPVRIAAAAEYEVLQKPFDADILRATIKRAAS